MLAVTAENVQLLGGLPQRRDGSRGEVTAVGVVFGAFLGLIGSTCLDQVVDVAAVGAVAAHHTYCEGIAQRDVQHEIRFPALVTALGRREPRPHLAGKGLGIGAVRDVANRATHGACTVECALRPLQDLDTLQVEKREIRRGAILVVGASVARHRYVVQIDRDGFLRFGLGCAGDAAHLQFFLVGACIEGGEARHPPRDVLNAAGTQFPKGIAGDGLYGHRRVLQSLVPALGSSDDDLLDGFGRIRSTRRQQCDCDGKYRGREHGGNRTVGHGGSPRIRMAV